MTDEGKGPAWVRCPCCENYLCLLHGKHAHDCACPPVEEWGHSPYEVFMPDTTLGPRLRSLRLAAGLTQQQLADRADINRVSLARLEAGRFSPRLAVARRLAFALGVDLLAVIGR